MNEIYVENMSFEILKIIVEFIYSSKLIINEANVIELLPAAKLLQIDDIVNSCSVFLMLNMNASNCIGFEEFASRYGCVQLKK